MTTPAITTPTYLPSTTSTNATAGSTSLTSSDFMNLMLKQLQNQDPLNPTDSNALLQQISQISTLQSNTQLQTSLTSMTLQQSIGSAGNLIGKTVQGIDASGNTQAGAVTAITVANQQVSLTLSSGATLPLANVLSIAPTPITTAAGATPAATNALTGLANIFQSLGLG